MHTIGLSGAAYSFFSVNSIVAVVGPVELWATRQRRPSAAANPQGVAVAVMFAVGIAAFCTLAERAGLRPPVMASSVARRVTRYPAGYGARGQPPRLTAPSPARRTIPWSRAQVRF